MQKTADLGEFENHHNHPLTVDLTLYSPAETAVKLKAESVIILTMT